MSKFARACILSYEEWVATIPEELPKPEYSKRHIRRMNALKNKMRGNVYHHFTTKTIRIMLVAAILFAWMMTAFVFPSSRDSFIDNFNIASRYQMTKNNKNSVPDEITVGYIPEGFELEDTQPSSKGILYAYSSLSNSKFTITKFTSAIEIYFDTETNDSEIIYMNNVAYTYSENTLSNNKNIVWIDNDYIYRVDGNLSKDEMFKIAESIKWYITKHPL